MIDNRRKPYAKYFSDDTRENYEAWLEDRLQEEEYEYEKQQYFERAEAIENEERDWN